MFMAPGLINLKVRVLKEVKRFMTQGLINRCGRIRRIEGDHDARLFNQPKSKIMKGGQGATGSSIQIFYLNF